jgi:hypothetical protein
MLQEKINQAIQILGKKDVDMWLTFVRETEAAYDPCLDLILGTNCTWQSAFIITRCGKTIAIVGSLDHERIHLTRLYQDIRKYIGSFKEEFLSVLNELSPRNIAINTSKSDYMSDGLTHGMYQLLKEYTSNTEDHDRFISSQEIVSATAWEENSCPAVFTGPDTAGAHADPTDRKIKKGHVLNIDFGVKKDEYCSDIQRTWYFLKDGETQAPAEIQKGFNTIIDAVQMAKDAIKPGKLGWEIDAVARDHIVSKGYPEYPHGLGHQVGRSTHDGAGLLGPRWERYRNTPYLPIEVGQVFTIEPRLPIEGYGVATVEEMIVVTKDGCEWLSHPQKEIFLI